MQYDENKVKEFTAKLLNNTVMTDQPLAFEPLAPEHVGKGTAVDASLKPGQPIETGAIIKPNGDVEFRIFAPAVNEVKIILLDMAPRPPIVLEKQSNGIHVGTFPYDPTFHGVMSMDVIFDGTCLVYPYIGVFWHRGRPVNFIEIPDPDTDFIFINDTPHGSVNREIFWSSVLNKWERLYVYTPAGYQKGGNYPVCYLLHGGGENETTWLYNGRASHIMDNLIAQGKCPPCIVVMPNTSHSYPGDRERYGRGASIPCAHDFMMRDVIPFIEGEYHVKTGWENTAICGLSAGGHQAGSIGLLHPDKFAYVGVFDAFLSEPHEPVGSDEELAILWNPEQFSQSYKMFYRGLGSRSHLMPKFEVDDGRFARCGVDQLPNYHRDVFEHEGHVWGNFRKAFHAFMHYAFQ